MDSTQRDYLARILPWPLPGAKGFVNIHVKTNPLDSEEKPQWFGRATTDVVAAINYIKYLQNTAGRVDIYACQSQQADAIEAKDKLGRTYLKAARSQAKSLFLKSLFLDVDIKHYDDSFEKLDEALNDFYAKAKLPPPTAVVNTSGGYHVYWTFKEYLTPDKWWPLAHNLVEATKQLNLKCDTQVTIDSSRILRVPNTLNYKRQKRVELVSIQPTDYDYDQIAPALLPFKVTAIHHSNGFTLAGFPKRVMSEEEKASETLGAGIEEYKAPPIKLEDVIDECEFIRDAVNTGGANNYNPLWTITTAAATFMENGRQVAHTMSDKHATYNVKATDELYDRMLAGNAKGVGWPQCQTIHGFGSKFCKTCKHFGKNKSPFNFRQTINHPPPPGAQPPDPFASSKAINILPANYRRTAQGCIQKIITNPEGASEYITVCETPIGDGWLQRHPWVLNFSAQTEPKKIEQIRLPFEVIGAMAELRRELSHQGVTIHDHNVKPVEEFFLSWIHTLKETKDAVVSTSPFGWNVNNGKMEGFVYAGKLFTPTDTKVAQPPDMVTSKGYTPVGSIQPWIDAAKLVTDQKRPALDAIIASSFAAPLVRFTNMRGLMMSCVGESGIGKSTALDIGLAVWGHPVKSKNLLHDTDNSVMNKIGELRSLPIFWDDLQPDDTRKYARMVFQISYGKEKDRMNAQAKRRESGTWQTLMVSTSNTSLMDVVTQHTNTTTAGIYRLFEIQVAKNHGLGQVAKADAARLVGKLDDNYGRVGEKYAQYLGANFLTLEDEVLNYQKALDLEVNAHNEERLWTSLIACICVGAVVANRLGFTTIDEAALRGFLIAALLNMREELKNQAVDLSKDINVTSILSTFCNAYRTRNTLFTNIIHKGRGKPASGAIKVMGDTSKLDAIYIHIGMDDKLIRINSNALTEWLKTKEISRQAFTTALKEKYGMKIVNGIIGGGTPHAVPGLAYMIEMSLLDFTDEIKVDELFEEKAK